MTDERRTVLVVEDDENSRLMYAAALRHFGYDVAEATNGAEGIEKARSDHPGLILMDIQMPFVDGYEATRVLKHDRATRDIPIVVITAQDLRADRERALELGCDGYLVKPCGPREVLGTVRRFLNADELAPRSGVVAVEEP